MKGVIDRFEGNYAVVELDNGDIIDLEIKKVPYGAKEGDVIQINKKEIIMDYKETKKRKKEIEELTKDLWED